MDAPQDPADPADPAPAADHELAARVAAWHNRHPLALRIVPAQVQGMGIVALPVRGEGRASRRAEPAFSENFMPPIAPRQAAAFAARHGVSEPPAVRPLRELAADSAYGAGAAAAQTLYLRTAAIEAAGQRVRVLVGVAGPGRPRPAVLGPRLWSLRRTLVAAALGGAGSTALLAAVVAGLWWLPSRSAPELAEVLAVAPTASAPSAASAASAALAESVPVDAPTAEPPLATSPAPAASAPHVAAAGDMQPADIRPPLSDEQRAEARRVGQQLRARDMPAPVAATASAPADGRHYALVARTTRGHAASQVLQSLMASAAAGLALPAGPRTEVFQVKEGFRAIWWPFASPADAEQARSVLAAYGVNAELVEF